MANKHKMSNRELFRILKEAKVFTKFYMACAEAWSNNYYTKPRTELNKYLNITAKRLMEDDMALFLDIIKNKWKLYNSNVLKLI